MLGLGIGPTFRAPLGGVNALAALIKALFGNDEEGGLWLPEPKYCWKDTAGTIPCTAAGDVVARVDDLSGNGNHATQASIDARPQLQQTAGGLWYLAFDGADDFLSAGAAPWLAASDVSASVAVAYKNQTTTPGYIISATNEGVGSFTAFSVLVYVTDNVRIGGQETTINDLSVLNETVIRLSFDKQALTGSAFINSVPVAVNVGDTSDATAPLVIAARTTGTAPKDARVFGVISASDEWSSTQGSAVDSFLAARSGVTLP